MKQIINRQSSAATDLKDRQQAKQYTGTAADGTGHQKAKQCSNRLLTDRQQAKQYTVQQQTEQIINSQKQETKFKN